VGCKEATIGRLILIHLTVLYFATLRQRVGLREDRLELAENSRVSDLLAFLKEQHAELGPALPSTLVSINREYASRDDALHDGDEVALFPPVSGGAQPQEETLIRTTKKALDLNQVLAGLAVPSTGTVCALTGVVNELKMKSTNHKERGQNELHSPIPEFIVHQIAREIRERWPVVRGIVVVQRVGRLETKTPNVLIACSAERGEADVYHAVQFGIDRLTHSHLS
jgi:molybdopterin converting factor small subunit/molybdopterin synthase catalytic subunit